MTLFDPTPYNTPNWKPPRTRTRKPRVAPELVAVRTGPAWRLVSQTTPGILHAQLDPYQPLAPFTGYVSACGLRTVAMSFDPG